MKHSLIPIVAKNKIEDGFVVFVDKMVNGKKIKLKVNWINNNNQTFSAGKEGWSAMYYFEDGVEFYLENKGGEKGAKNR